MNRQIFSQKVSNQSENIILDLRDTKKSFVGFMSAPKRKNTVISDIYFAMLEAAQFPPKLVTNKNAYTKDRRTWIPFKVLKTKSEQVVLLFKFYQRNLNNIQGAHVLNFISYFK